MRGDAEVGEDGQGKPPPQKKQPPHPEKLLAAVAGRQRSPSGPGCPQPARYLRDRRCSVPTCPAAPAGLVPPRARLFQSFSSCGAAPRGRVGPRRSWRGAPAAAVGPGSSLAAAAAAALQRRLEAGTAAEEGGSGAGVHGGGPGGSRCLGDLRAPAAISPRPGTGGAARAGRSGGARGRDAGMEAGGSPGAVEGQDVCPPASPQLRGWPPAPVEGGERGIGSPPSQKPARLSWYRGRPRCQREKGTRSLSFPSPLSSISRRENPW